MMKLLIFPFILSLVFSLPLIIDVEFLDPAQGLTFKGGPDQVSLGYTASNAGDINGDGVEDIILGGLLYDAYTGIVFVIYGRTSLADFTVDLNIGPSQGFFIMGSAVQDCFGTSLTALGDINGDGIDDFFVMALCHNDYIGVMYVFYGARSGLTNIYLSQGLDPSRGYAIINPGERSVFGMMASSAGDINGDGIKDFMVGQPTYQVSIGFQGVVHVIYGKSSNSANKTLNIEPDPAEGFVIWGPSRLGYFGAALSAAGDINGDGIDDVIIGCMAVEYGLAYVIYGSKDNRKIVLDYGLNRTQGFAITGSESYGYLGWSVSKADDLDNDGVGDILIGGPRENGVYGGVVVVYGDKSGFSNISLLAGSSNSNEITVIYTAEPQYLGCAVYGGGDINADGIDDIVLHRNGDDIEAANTAFAYVIYGSNNRMPESLTLSVSNFSAAQGFILTADPTGSHLEPRTAFGDFNGDYLPDILVGAPFSNNLTGGASIIFGSNGCPKNCSRCSSASVCSECFGNLGLYKSQCWVNCPKGTYFLNGKCSECAKGCIECSSATTCLSCTSEYILINQQHCVPEGQSLQTNITGAALDSVATLGNSVAIGSSMATNFGLVAKILRNIRYLNVTVSSELEEAFYTWKVSSGFISMPKSWSTQSDPELLPAVFDRYDIGSVFLVNYWKSLIMILIGLGVFVIFKAIDKRLGKKGSKLGSTARSINVIASNFTLTQIYGSLDDVMFFLVLQTRSANFRIDFQRASFGLSIVFLVFGILILGAHILILYRYRKEKRSAGLKVFLEKHENLKMLFQDFKDSDLLKQSFLLIYINRSIISNLIITNLFEYPLLQTLLLTGLNVLILVYLIICQPFKEKLNTCGQYFCEGILLVVNVSMLGMAIVDEMTEKPEGVVERFSKAIVVLNMVLVVGSLIFMGLSIGKALYTVYKARKAEVVEKSSKNMVGKVKETAELPRIIVPSRTSILDQSACDLLNASRGPSFFDANNTNLGSLQNTSLSLISQNSIMNNTKTGVGGSYLNPQSPSIFKKDSVEIRKESIFETSELFKNSNSLINDDEGGSSSIIYGPRRKINRMKVDRRATRTRLNSICLPLEIIEEPALKVDFRVPSSVLREEHLEEKLKLGEIVTKEASKDDVKIPRRRIRRELTKSKEEKN